MTDSFPSQLFLNSRLHLVKASLPPVVMAGEQEVNQHSIISQPAPGGNSASHATTPLSVGTPASLGTPHNEAPRSIPMGYRQCALSVPGHTCDTALISQWEPSSSRAYFKMCVFQREKEGKKSSFYDRFVQILAVCVIFFQFLVQRYLRVLQILLLPVDR